MIKRFLFLLFFGLSIIHCSENGTESPNDDPDQIPDLPGWDLVWNDEFNGTHVATTRWNYEVNGAGGGNNELQYYTDRQENSFVQDGLLHMVALKEEFTGPDGTRDYTSARMTTRSKGDWIYGRFDIKAKLPYGQGMWPAIWMMPTESVYGGWAASGEIDIMENLGHETRRTYGTLHFGASFPQNAQSGGSYVLPSGSFASDFHLFTLEWEETEFRWYVDGVHYLTKNEWHTVNQLYPAPFDQEFFLILNVAVGGNWPGNPDETTVFPQEMIVDYARVYIKAE